MAENTNANPEVVVTGSAAPTAIPESVEETVTVTPATPEPTPVPDTVQPVATHAATPTQASDTTETMTNAPTQVFGVVTAKMLNIRQKPNKTGAVICVVPEGTEVEIKNVSSDGWARVYIGTDVKGYAMVDFIKEN